MSMAIAFPRTHPQQAASVHGLQATPQQSGIGISSIMTLLMPVMVVGMMSKMVKPGALSKTGKVKKLETAKAKSTKS